jgi:hypothetical protein
LGRLRLHQRSGKNQTNPSRIPCRSQHPRLNLSLLPNPSSIEADPSRYLFVPDRFRGEADLADQELVVVHPCGHWVSFSVNSIVPHTWCKLV